MSRIDEICRKHGIVLCYLFGSRQEQGKALLDGADVRPSDPESDIDFAVLFSEPPEDAAKAYALLSLDLQDLVLPFRADLLFLHEVDHIIQLEAIKGINVYCSGEDLRDEYEEKVMAFASDEMAIFRLNEKDMFEAIEDGYFELEYEAR